jgi:hypothetical protein
MLDGGPENEKKTIADEGIALIQQVQDKFGEEVVNTVVPDGVLESLNPRARSFALYGAFLALQEEMSRA